MNISSILFLLPCVATLVRGDVTLQFNDFDFALTGLTSAQGTTGETGLLWGIVVDTAGDGYQAFSVSLDEGNSLTNGLEVAPGDYLFLGGVTSAIPPAFGESGSGVPTGSGGLPAFSVPAVGSGQSFALVWFDTGVAEDGAYQANLNYGLLTNSAFILPADSSVVSFASLFVGADPVRPANLQVQAILPPIDCRIINNRLAVEFVVNATTAENVSFDLEVLQVNQANPWQLAGVSPQVISSNGGLETIRLSLSNTVTSLPQALVRVQVVPAP